MDQFAPTPATRPVAQVGTIVVHRYATIKKTKISPQYQYLYSVCPYISYLSKFYVTCSNLVILLKTAVLMVPFARFELCPQLKTRSKHIYSNCIAILQIVGSAAKTIFSKTRFFAEKATASRMLINNI